MKKKEESVKKVESKDSDMIMPDKEKEMLGKEDLEKVNGGVSPILVFPPKK